MSYKRGNNGLQAFIVAYNLLLLADRTTTVKRGDTLSLVHAGCCCSRRSDLTVRCQARSGTGIFSQ